MHRGRVLRSLLAILALGAARSAAQQRLAISGATLIDGTGAPPRTATVVIEGSRIAAIGGAPPAGARIVDGRGKYLVPGFWDSHVHLLHTDPATLGVFLANGVTGIREMGGDVARTRAWRAEVEAGRLPGPRIFFSGPILERGTYFENLRRMEGELGSGFVRLMERTRIAVGAPAEARGAIDSVRALGADFVKVRTTSNRETALAILREAERAGLKVAGHAPDGATPGELAAAGFASIEHGFWPPLFDYSAAERRHLFAPMVRHGTFLTPTLISGHQARVVPDSVGLGVIADSSNRRDPRRRYVSDTMLVYWRRFYASKRFESPLDWREIARFGIADVASADSAGVQLLAGTDLGVTMIYPGFSLHDELALLAEAARVPPVRVLQAATRNAAMVLGIVDSVGTIAIGMAADLVLLDANPLADIRNTRRIRAVIARGRLFDRAALDSLLARGARAARPGDP